MTTTPQRIDFENAPTFLITALANKLSIAASRRVRRRLGIGLMEWRTLALLAVEAEATPGRVAQVAGVDKSVVSRAVGALERRGLIVVMPDAAPGRQTRLRITDAGQELHDLGIGDTRAVEDALLDGLSPEERRQLSAMLKRLTENLPQTERQFAESS